MGLSVAKRRGYRLDIEGLRAVAIVTVVLYHAGVPGLGGGFVGVDVFFVLSGFLITELLWREVQRGGRISFATFYSRRARRILPVSTLVIVATSLLAWRVVPPLELHSVTRDGLASALFVANIRFAAAHTSYLTVSAPSAFQQYWSLGVEEQFYLIWPAVLLGVSVLATRRGRRPDSPATALGVLAGLSLTSLVACWWLTRVNQPWAFFSLPTRAWELGAGALLALGQPWIRRLGVGWARGLGWAGLAAVVYASTRLSSATAYPGLAALLPVGGCAAVVAAGCSPHPWGAERLLGLRPFRFFGRISYALYLWHWPLLVLVPVAVGHSLSLAANLGLVAVAVALSAATVVVIEAPIRFSPALSAPPRRALALGAALIVVAVVATVALPIPTVRGTGVAVALPVREPPPAVHPDVDPLTAELAAATAPITQAVADSVAIQAVPANLQPPLATAHSNEARPFIDGCLASFTATVPGSCTYGSSQPVATVVLYGDSHAAMWFPPLDAMANARNWKLVVLTKATCPPLQTPVFAPNFGREYRECDQFRAAALARIAALHPQLVVLGMNRAYGSAYHLDQYGPEWLQGLSTTISTIKADGSSVLVMGPVPHPANDEPNCLSQNLNTAIQCSQAVSDAYDVAGLAQEQAATVAAGGHYLDVKPWFCTVTRCAVIVGNLLVYRDENHLTTTYANWLTPAFEAQLDVLRVLPPPPPPPSSTSSTASPATSVPPTTTG